jgi:MFS family permease
MVTLIWSFLSICCALVYGPMAAWLVELFPQKIRYTSLSLAYNIGNGWFGSFVSTIGFAVVICTGNIYSGLWYPAIVALTSFIIGMLFLKETKNRDI